MNIDKDIDVVGKSCPLPLIRLAKEVREMSAGQVVCVTGNDPIFEPSAMDFCQEGGHEVLEVRREGRKISITFRVGAGGG